MVWIKSLVTGHKVVAIRPRNNDKLEVLRFDPYSESFIRYNTFWMNTKLIVSLVERFCVYKEAEKIRGAKY